MRMGAPPRVVVLTRQPDSHAVTRLKEAASKRELPLHAVDPHELYLQLITAEPATAAAPGVAHPALGEDWRGTVVLPRLASLATEYSLAALDLLERAGARAVNGYGALLRLRYKFGALAELRAAELEVPETVMLRAPSDIAPAVEQLGGYPVVLKFIRGSQGVGVIFAPDAATVTSVVEALNLVQYDVMLQRYYPRGAGSDLRVLVLGGEPRWAVRRQAGPDGFRANFHRGGTAETEELSAELAEVARRAAAVFGLGLAGVDLIEGDEGLLVLEVNASPGFQAIEECHQVDVAAAILDYVGQLRWP